MKTEVVTCRGWVGIGHDGIGKGFESPVIDDFSNLYHLTKTIALLFIATSKFITRKGKAKIR